MRPQQFFVHPSVASVLLIDDGQSFPNAVAAGTANVSLPLAGSV